MASQTDSERDFREKQKVKTVTKLGGALLVGGTVFVAGHAAAQQPPYVIQNGQLDEATWIGMKIYQRGRCETCHGPDAAGGAAFPNLLEALKKGVDKATLTEIVKNGRGSMPPMLENVMNIKMIKKKGITEEQAMDSLYAYLKGRSDGAIPAGSLKKIKK